MVGMPVRETDSMSVKLRYDGIYDWCEGDNIAFTVMSHFIGADGRDYYQTSWTGVEPLLRMGLDLTSVEIILEGGRQ